jgi:ubiquinone biosynthesis accessory factor UbiJ
MPAEPTLTSPRSPNPVLGVLGRGLAAALNRLVDLDPDTRAALRSLDGRAITVEFRNTPLAMRMTVAGDRLTVGPAFDGESALRIAASPSAFIGLVLARGREGSIAPGKVDISGDADLARRLERIATRFAPDFDEAFAKVFGDVVGFQIARAFRRALALVRDSSRAFARDAAEFLTEESRDVVAKPEIETFLDEVDALRERADRLEARVRRIAASSAKPLA